MRTHDRAMARCPVGPDPDIAAGRGCDVMERFGEPVHRKRYRCVCGERRAQSFTSGALQRQCDGMRLNSHLASVNFDAGEPTMDAWRLLAVLK